MKFYIAFNIVILSAIAVILPTSCDKEYEIEHPTADTYISPADQVYLDIKEGDYE